MLKGLAKFLLRFFAVIGVFVVVGFLLFIALIGLATKHVGISEEISEHTILELDLKSLPLERVVDPFAEVNPQAQLSLLDVVTTLDQAGRDPKVKSLLLRLVFPDQGVVGFAKIQELREAILNFRAQGKQVIAYTDTFGEGFSGNQSYYLASACDQIYLQPSGEVGLNGLLWEEPFLKDGLKHWGIEFDVYKRHEYKTALNPLTETGFTQAHRESVESLLSSLIDQVTEGIAQSRQLDLKQVNQLIDQGPYLAEEALKRRLVDGLLYRDQVVAHAKKLGGPEAQLLYLHKYFAAQNESFELEDDSPVVALIYGVGPVQRGSSGSSPFSAFEDPVIASDDVAAAIRQAVAEEDVKAILLRINSPGGSYIASDMIWREVVKARASGKPVIASMSDIAGSGGYFVAMAADKIIAQPGTLTGSIGVISGKLETSEFWQKLHIQWDHAQVGDNANMLSSLNQMSPEQRKKMEDTLDTIYKDFVTKAAQGRKMTFDQMHQLAKGRIWTGAHAKELGLVDELGGFATSLAAIRQALGLSEDQSLTLTIYPPEKTLVEQIVGSDANNSEDYGSQPFDLSLPPLFTRLKKIEDALQNEGVLTMPLPWVD